MVLVILIAISCFVLHAIAQAEGQTVHHNDTDSTGGRDRFGSTWKFDLSECGTKKGCWFMPGECDTGANDRYTKCHSIVTWRVDEQNGGKRNLVLELDTRTDDMQNRYLGKYASIGFTDDYKMGEDFVIECLANPSGDIKAFLSFNDGMTNLRSAQASKILLSNTRGTYRDGRLTCQTTYAIDEAKNAKLPEDEAWRIVNIDRPFYFFFARGDSDPQTDELHMHYLMDGDQFPWISTERTDVSKETKRLTAAKHYDIPRSIQYQLVQAHGIIMLFAWWVFAAVAMFISRYFKSMWPDKKFCGQAVWFQLHRALLIISLILQCSAFALIFIQAGTIFTCNRICDEHAYYLMLHTYLGVATTAAALIQPFMALCRPSPASPKRPIFNWLHWFFGTGAFVCATVTIFISAVLGKGGLRRLFGYKPEYIMGGYVVAYVVCSIIFEMIWYCRYRYEETPAAPIKLTTVGPRSQLPSKTDSFRGTSYVRIQTAVLVFFAIAAAALCAALSYYITANHH